MGRKCRREYQIAGAAFLSRFQRPCQPLGVVVAFLWCAALSSNVGSAQLTQTDPTVFRTETALVRLDVSVVDASGHPIADLLPSDFEVRQAGKQRPVLFAEFRRLADLNKSLQPTTSQIGSASGGRRIVVVVDDLRMSFESVVRVRNELFAALRANAAADDQMMVVGTRGRDRTIAFTTDPVVLKTQVEALHWEAPTRGTEPDANDRRRTCMDAPGSENVLDVECADASLAFITSAVSDLRSQPGRKIILLLADGINNNTCPEYRWRFEERLRRLTDLASRTASIIYALQTHAFSSGVRMPDQRTRSSDVTGPPDIAVTHNEVSEWMKKLAEPTGGYADRANSMTVLVSAALKDASSYYVLAYEPPPGTFTGGKVQYRRVQVRVSKRGAIVRTRAGFYSIAASELVSK